MPLFAVDARHRNIPSDRGECSCEGGASCVGEPASANPIRLEMEGSVHLGCSMTGEGGNCACS